MNYFCCIWPTLWLKKIVGSVKKCVWSWESFPAKPRGWYCVLLLISVFSPDTGLTLTFPEWNCCVFSLWCCLRFHLAQDLFLHTELSHNAIFWPLRWVLSYFACELLVPGLQPWSPLSWLLAPTSCLRAGLAFWSGENPRLPQHIPPFDSALVSTGARGTTTGVNAPQCRTES